MGEAPLMLCIFRQEAKSLVKSSIRAAWPKCRNVRPRFQRRSPARRSSVTPVAAAVGISLPAIGLLLTFVWVWRGSSVAVQRYRWGSRVRGEVLSVEPFGSVLEAQCIDTQALWVRSPLRVGVDPTAPTWSTTVQCIVVGSLDQVSE